MMKRPVVFRIILYSAIVCVTLWIVRLNLPDPKEEWSQESAIAIHKYLLTQIGKKPLGKEIYEVNHKISKQEIFKFPEYEHFTGALPVLTVESANLEQAHKLADRVEQSVSELLALAREGALFPSEQSLTEWLQTPKPKQAEPQKPDVYRPGKTEFLAMNFLVRSLLIESQMHSRENSWKEAIQSLSDIVRLSDTLRYEGFMGHLIAVLLRWQASYGFESILLVNHPSDVDRAALDALNAICAHHIQYDEKTFLSQRLSAILYLLGERDGRALALRDDLNAVLGLITIKDSLKQPENRKWVERQIRRLGLARYSAEELDNYMQMGEAFLMGRINWTTRASVRKFLRRVGKSENELMEPIPVIRALGEQLPPVLRAHLITDAYRPLYDLDSALARLNAGIARLELLRTAFAMRLYYQRNGKFPQAVEQLVPDYLERVPMIEFDRSLYKHTRIPDPNLILSPIRIARADLAVENIASALRIHLEPHYAGSAYRIAATTFPNGAWGWRDLPGKVGEVMAQYLGHFDRVIEGVSVEPGKDGAKNVLWRFKVPQQAIALYAPGPDLDGDGAKIMYDPSNGTISNGDTIVYPEGFAR